MSNVPPSRRWLLHGLLDLVFPPQCLTCAALAEPFCAHCRAEIRRPAGAQPVPHGLADLRSAGYHDGPLREAVLRLKFGRKVALVEPLADLLADELTPLFPLWRPDLIAPVPNHWTRRFQRGFNQSELLAREVARRCDLPYRPVLLKLRATRPQVGLTADERAQNLRGALGIDSREPLRGSRVVVIDDVTTTGATLAACAVALQTAGATAVYGLTVTVDA